MRTRLNPHQRKLEIIAHAKKLFHQHGFAHVEMTDICKASGVSRGGLYHHFDNKAAVLDAIVATEISELADAVEQREAEAIEFLLETGSSHLGNSVGIAATLMSTSEKLAYLSSLDTAITQLLAPILAHRLTASVRSNVNAGHVAELFLTVNAHINRRIFLGDWTDHQGAEFAATALAALAPFFKDASRLRQIIKSFESRSREH